MTSRAVKSGRRASEAGWVLLLGVLLSGCVTTTVYQPLSSLQRPSIVDPQLANFEGMRLLVRCVPGDYLNASDTDLLCRKVGSLFRNQGARVETDVSRSGRPSRSFQDGTPPDLVVDLTSRLLHKESSGVLWALTVISLTIVPAVTEYSVAQDVTIRDASGFVLASDSLKARFIEYFGAGVWGVNWVLDAVVRPPEEEITGEAASRDFSRDFYAQLSQLAFNARVRADVLRSFEPRPQGGGDPRQTGTVP
ncbi:MAG TPA: hypothetical protein VFZ09_35700 [Archangium sp.]|uniref:hypothetical protein n=1 Tax=Archangium sp. TaxID=1872627 RepID=UPI002E2F65C8|nr:hypothetical protein [Archangium sp.]HEX5751622.1 hypothetical protein [Archangium sp.]